MPGCTSSFGSAREQKIDADALRLVMARAVVPECQDERLYITTKVYCL